MGESLKDQLVALGLAKAGAKKPARPAGANKKKRKGAGGPRKANGEMSLDAAWRLRDKEEKKAAAEKKQAKQEQDRLRRELNAKIQQLVEAHALNDKAADIKRNFLFKGRIRSVLVTPAQLQALNAGELGLVFLRGSYFIMAPENVEQVRALSADHVPDLAGGAGDDAEEEFPVPDDLTW